MAKPRQAAVNDELLAFEQLKERYEDILSSQGPRPTLDQIRMVAQGLCSAEHLAQTSRKVTGDSGWAGQTFVLDVITALGTWLTHSQGSSHVHAVNLDAQSAQVGAHQCLAKECTPSKPVSLVAIPFGYKEGEAGKRNIDRALTAVIRHQPDDETLGRFAARVYGTRTAAMNYQVIAGVWGFAARGRLSSLHRVSEDPVFLAKAIEAYQILSTAREDGVAALLSLMSQEASGLDEVESLARTALWVSEADLTRVVRSVETARMRGSDALVLVERDIRRLEHLATQEPERFLPDRVGSLTLAHVRRISEAAGIDTDPGDRALERSIRAQLKALGVHTDADILLPEALRASANGQMDRFWEIIGGRADGDSGWMSQLEELSA